MANNGKNSNMIVGLDIGTSKVVCIVGKYNSEKSLEIVALGAYPSSGLKIPALLGKLISSLTSLQSKLLVISIRNLELKPISMSSPL